MAAGKMILTVNEERLGNSLALDVTMEYEFGDGLSPQATTLVRTLSREVRLHLDRLQAELQGMKH